MNEVLKEISQTLKNKTVITAISGGPDSMCLLNLLLKVKCNTNINIIAAHVNHNLREESKKEAQMVKEFCIKNNIKYEYEEIIKYEGNTEEYGRKKRYSFFENLTKKYNADYLLTAHHGDDLSETIIMRMIKGTNIKEMIGFKKITNRENYKIYRPLICLTKEEIINYCKKNNIKYALDKSNEEDIYMRNRVRKYILPELKKENDSVHKNFIKFSNSLIEYEDYFQKKSKQIEANIYIDKKLNVEKFNKLDKIFKKKIIYRILKEVYKNKIKMIKENHIEKIIEVLNNTNPNIKINLPLNYVFEKAYNKGIITKEQKYKSYNYILENEIKLQNNHIIKIIDKTKDTSNYTLKLNSNNIKLPLHIRNRKDGDKIEVKNLNGTKKIKDIFIDEKIPKEDRYSYPLLTDDNDQILWIPGIKKSKFDVSNSENYDIIVKYF